jgi:hypothetical protein
MGNSVRDVCYEGTNLLQFETHMHWRVIGNGTINSQQLEEVSSDVIFCKSYVQQPILQKAGVM